MGQLWTNHGVRIPLGGGRGRGGAKARLAEEIEESHRHTVLEN